MPQITAAGFPVKFGPKTYTMSPLDDRDSDEIDNWLRSTHIQMVRASLTSDMSPTDREEMLGIAFKQARKLSFVSGEGAELISSVEGFVRVFYQGIKKNHPKLTYAEFWAEIFALKTADETALAADIDASMGVFKEINVGAEAAAPEGEGKKPVAADSE